MGAWCNVGFIACELVFQGAISLGEFLGRLFFPKKTNLAWYVDWYIRQQVSMFSF